MNQTTRQFREEFRIIKPKIFDRDNWQCMVDCHNHFGPLDVDHIRKRSLGGTNDPKYLITICRGGHARYEMMDNHTKEKILLGILKANYGYDYRV